MKIHPSEMTRTETNANIFNYSRQVFIIKNLAAFSVSRR